MGSSGTGAFVGIDEVDADAPVMAGLRKAFVDLTGAVYSMISWQTLQKKKGGKKTCKVIRSCLPGIVPPSN